MWTVPWGAVVTRAGSGIRNRYHCLVAGVEKSDGTLHTPDIKAPFEEGDILWIVGEKEDVEKVMES